MAAQLAVLLLKFEDARDSSQVDAFLLAELLRLREAGDNADWGRQDTDEEILLTIRIPKRVRT